MIAAALIVGLSMSNELLLQIAAMLLTSGAIYAGLREAIAKATAKAEYALQRAEKANERIDKHVEKHVEVLK